MADAQHMHASKMARGEEAYQGKLLEARQNDYKVRSSACNFNAPDFGARLGGLVGRSGRYGENKNFLRAFRGTADVVYVTLDPCMW